MIKDDIPLDTRVAHILDEFTESEFGRLADHLAAADSQAGFSVPTMHLQREWVRNTIHDLAAGGHSIVLHGQLHTSYMETLYETAVDELSAAIDTIQAVSGKQPVGFHVPYSRVSSQTERAAVDLGVDWIIGGHADDGTVLPQT